MNINYDITEYVDVLKAQRNSALDENAQLAAAVRTLSRKLAELEAKEKAAENAKE